MKIKHYDDLGYQIRFEVFNSYLKFKVYQLFDSGTTLENANFNSTDNFGGPQTIEEASVFLSGMLRFDGCCNFKFDSQEKCMIHTCSKIELSNIGTLLERIHDLGEYIDGWCGE